uniref:Protocadherin Fat 4 n=1 Tax=Magallana gigas TaxID=29159 RepID=K1PY39_MAGGI
MADIMYFLACTRSNGVRDPNVTALVYESTGSEFDPNSPLYKTDTTIEGINGGTDVNSGVNLTIARTQATPSSVILNELVELVMLNVSNSPFGKRSFIRLKKEIDRDSTPVGTTVYSGISATDLDAGQNKEIEYAIVAGDGSIDKASNPAERRQATTTITISVNDVDDLGPKFVYTGCVEVDNVSLPPGYQNRFQVSTQQVSGSANQYQAIITQTSPLDRYQVPELELFIEGRETQTHRYSKRATIKITIAAANNNNPVLTVPFQGFIYENSPVGTIPRNSDGSNLLKISVTDPDLISGETGTYTYTVGGTSLFRVNREGYVEAASVMNYETNSVVTFSVTGTEVGTQNPRGGSVQVTVNVRDLNDNSPVFEAPRYTDTIVEGDYTTSNQVLLDVKATDDDSGAFGDIAYTIQSVSNNGASKFTIQPSSQQGQATISCVGTVAEGEIYVIMVQATDQGQPIAERRSTSVPVEVTVTPLGTRPPVIDSAAFTISVSEAVPLSSSLWTVPARDPEGLPLTFTITAGNNNSDFIINSTTGELRTARRLNREGTPQYTLNIQVQDQSGLTAQTTLTIIVQDVNDNNPVFIPTSYTFSVFEGRTNEPVGTVTATDSDTGANALVNYQISPYSSTDSANLFFITSTGAITTATALDYEVKQRHVILVLGTDGGVSSRTGTATVTINVQDVQDVIPLFTETNIERSIPERQPTGTSVAQVLAIDQDTVDSITYKFSTGDFTVFNINSNSGVITNNQLLQYETRSRYVFTVTTAEGESSNALSATATVTINIQDINNYPPVIQAVPSNLQFLENIPMGTELLSSIAVTDADAQINVNVQDGGVPPLSAYTTVTITVIKNTAPFFPAPKTTTVTIPNTRNSDSEVITYTATDNDARPEFNQVTYSMVTDTTAASLFRLEPTSGRITLVSSLTADDAPRYLLTITATDNGGLSDTGTVTVSVNRNLNDPQWLPTGGPYSATVNVTENRPVLETVYTLSTRDLDIQEPFNTRIYSILSTSSAAQHFQISSQGNVQITRSLAIDRAVNQYVLTIQLRDGGNRVAAQQFTLTVNVIRNTNPPVFFDTSYYQEIEETLAVGTSILRVQASDQDPELQFRTITYTLLANTAGNNLFSMDQGTGIIRVKSALTGDPTMVAVATDGGSPSQSANAMVTIKVNRNRNTPVWNSLNYQATILETQTVALPLTLSPTGLSASDSDAQPPNNVVNYRLTAVVARSGSTVYANEQGNFAVSNTGQVTVRSPLNGLTATEYLLYVEAYDLGDPSTVSSSNATVTINVQRNRAPVFVQTSYTFDMNEVATVNPQTVVGQVLANDPDNGIPEFNTLSYAIENIGIGSPNAYLAIDSNGRITLQNIVSGIQDKEFRFLVRVSDNGVPSLTDEAVVTVNIKRNLWTPAFNPLNYAVTIQETLPVGAEIGVTVAATDQDLSAPNNQVVYSANGDQSAIQYFDIDATSGKVLVKQPLYTGTSSQYILTVRVADSATPPLESQQTASVTITVERNQFPPVFRNLPTTRSLPRTAGFGFSVYTVFANDSDIRSPFNVVSYSLVSGTNQFQIDQTTGQITLQTNSLTQAEYVLTVEARDGADIPRRSYSTLTLTVDSNLEKPVWVNPRASSSYEATVTIYETHDYVTSVFSFSANDIDSVSPYNTVRYVVEGNGNAPNFFTVADNGQTFLKTSLLQRTETQFVLLVRAEDGGNPPRQADNKARLTINVIRNNNAPQWQNPMTTTLVSQQAGIGQTVGNALLATDSDTFFNVVRYEIIGDGDSTAFFTIANPANGQITVANSLASSSDLVYYIRVRAYDNGVPAKDNVTVVTVTVERNNFAPEINPPTVSARIPESQDLGVTIATVTATDRDTQSPHNVIRYQMFASTPASNYFGIDSQTGNIFVKRDLTLDTSNRYLMYVQAYDIGSPSKTSVINATVTIDIYRNLRDPFFSGEPFAANIPETSVIGTSVLQVNFGDSDTNAPFNTVTVSAIGDDKALTFFRLESNGQINVNSDLKADSLDIYTLRILACDGGYPKRTTTTKVNIHVQRNLHAPVYDRRIYNGTVLEQDRIGRPFTQVTATDSDTQAPNNQIMYKITESETPAINYFYLHPQTGHISLKQCLNGTDNRFIFNITATDGGSPPLSDHALVDVEVKGCPKCRTNINSPRFFAPVYFVNIKEGEYSKNNLHLIQISATDDDDGYDGDILFDIQSVSNNGNDKFKLEQDRLNTNANIICSGTLNRGETYVIMVRASDQALQMDRRRSSYVPVEVRVVP